ncbi:MAG: DnaJ domain-containing protein, partial [Desulfobacterales bacterium]
SRESFESFARQFHARFQHQPQLLELMVDILLRVASSDGGMGANEERLIQTAVGIFQMGPQRYAALRSRYVNDLDQHYAALKLTPEASVEEIKKSYRQLVREFHPDTIASKGLPDEFTRFASEKFQEIQSAYETIMAQRGEK